MSKIDLNITPWDQYNELGDYLHKTFSDKSTEPITVEIPLSKIFKDAEGKIPISFNMYIHGSSDYRREFGHLRIGTTLLYDSSEQLCKLARSQQLNDKALGNLNRFISLRDYKTKPYSHQDVEATLGTFFQFGYRCDTRILYLNNLQSGILNGCGLFGATINHLADTIDFDCLDHILLKHIIENGTESLLHVPKATLQDNSKAAQHFKENYQKSPLIRTMRTTGFGDISVKLTDNSDYDLNGEEDCLLPMFIKTIEARQSPKLEIYVSYD